MKLIVEKSNELLFRKLVHEKLNDIDKLTEITIALSVLRQERDKLVDRLSANDELSNTYFMSRDIHDKA